MVSFGGVKGWHGTLPCVCSMLQGSVGDSVSFSGLQVVRFVLCRQTVTSNRLFFWVGGGLGNPPHTNTHHELH